MASKNTLQVNDQSFQAEVIQSNQLTVVDFWAEWCGPCKMLAPTLDSLAEEYNGKIKIVKMNVDENPDTPSQFRIRGIPTLIFFKNGSMVDQLVGNQPRDAIATAIDKHLA